MRSRSAVLSLAAILALALLYSCSDSTDPGEEGLTEEQKQAILEAHATVSQTADAVLLTDDPFDGFEAMASSYRDVPGVEEVWLTEDGLAVKYESGPTVAWYVARDPIVPPYDAGSPEAGATPLGGWMPASRLEPVGNSEAVLLNALSRDNRFFIVDLLTDDLETKLDDSGFNVTRVDGEDIDLDFMEDELSRYGMIFFTTHGIQIGGNHYIATGQEGTVDEMVEVYPDDFANDRIALMVVVEYRPLRTIQRYYGVSEHYFDNYYADDAFPHSFLYLTACQVFAANTRMATVLSAKGVAAVVGWTANNCWGIFTGRRLVEIMLGGLELGEAFSALPDESKVDNCIFGGPGEAVLEYHPPSGQSLQLVERFGTAEIELDSPVAGTDYANRSVTLAGRVTGPESIGHGVVSLNGIATTLTASGLEFSQPLVLRGGMNVLEVSIVGPAADGKTMFGTTGEVTFMGAFPPLDLWTELRWNNRGDVDFHLLPPGKDVDALFSGDDCHFMFDVTDWGCTLDVDDIDGYGPEHITVEAATVPGIYRLFVHFFYDLGAGPADAFVSVAVRDGDALHFGPFRLVDYGEERDGDIWEVATIEYPSGTVRYVGRKVEASPTPPPNMTAKRKR
jgi:uncharacterized protein YfaP (DUF2135 family)